MRKRGLLLVALIAAGALGNTAPARAAGPLIVSNDSKHYAHIWIYAFRGGPLSFELPLQPGGSARFALDGTRAIKAGYVKAVLRDGARGPDICSASEPNHGPGTWTIRESCRLTKTAP